MELNFEDARMILASTPLGEQLVKDLENGDERSFNMVRDGYGGEELNTLLKAKDVYISSLIKSPSGSNVTTTKTINRDSSLNKTVKFTNDNLNGATKEHDRPVEHKESLFDKMMDFIKGYGCFIYLFICVGIGVIVGVSDCTNKEDKRIKKERKELDSLKTVYRRYLDMESHKERYVNKLEGKTIDLWHAFLESKRKDNECREIVYKLQEDIENIKQEIILSWSDETKNNVLNSIDIIEDSLKSLEGRIERIEFNVEDEDDYEDYDDY